MPLVSRVDRVLADDRRDLKEERSDRNKASRAGHMSGEVSSGRKSTSGQAIEIRQGTEESYAL